MASTSSSSSPMKYDVFLNFRGSDTRNGFTGHLYEMLRLNGVETFFDEKEIEVGDRINQILEQIPLSRMFIVVFSRNYAESKWCLRELTEIINTGRRIVPVFLKVTPENVSCKPSQNSCEDFLQAHKNGRVDGDRLNEWRDALDKATRVKGLRLEEDASGKEANLVSLIMNEVFKHLVRKPLMVAKHPVKIQTQVLELVKKLETVGDDVRVIGVHGMPGIGKSTFAKALYNTLSHDFQFTFYMSDIGACTELLGLQKILICGLTKTEDASGMIDKVDGWNRIKQRLSGCKVLLVLDDIRRDEQLEYLLGSLEWVGQGSRIIITTRDEGLLSIYNNEQLVRYKAQVLTQEDALQLFSFHVFGNSQPLDDYVELSNEVVKACGCLPLALVKYGLLFSRRAVRDWKEELDKIQEFPERNLHLQLMPTYEKSLDSAAREVFLDIACFFNGMERELPFLFWNELELHPGPSISALMENSLLDYSADGKFCMNEQVWKIGRAIVVEKNGKPMERSRIWKYKDIHDAINNRNGTRNIVKIGLESGEDEKYGRDINLNSEAFQAMSNLRMLHVPSAGCSTGNLSFPANLKWLHWPYCPLLIPLMNANISNIVMLDLEVSCILSWQASAREMFERLKYLKLSGCNTCTGNTLNRSLFPNLERLIMDNSSINSGLAS